MEIKSDNKQQKNMNRENFSIIAIVILLLAGCAKKTIERDLDILPYPKKMSYYPVFYDKKPITKKQL
jgi:hypothetical protein